MKEYRSDKRNFEESRKERKNDCTGESFNGRHAAVHDSGDFAGFALEVESKAQTLEVVKNVYRKTLGSLNRDSEITEVLDEVQDVSKEHRKNEDDDSTDWYGSTRSQRIGKRINSQLKCVRWDQSNHLAHGNADESQHG